MVVLLPSSLRSLASWMRLPIAPPWHSWSKAFLASFWQLLLWSSGAPDFFTSSMMAAIKQLGNGLVVCSCIAGAGSTWPSSWLHNWAWVQSPWLSYPWLLCPWLWNWKSKFKMEDGKSNSYTITSGFMFFIYCEAALCWIMGLNCTIAAWLSILQRKSIRTHWGMDHGKPQGCWIFAAK